MGIIAGIYVAADLNKQEGFVYKDEAAKELKEKGITADQKYSAYKPGVSEMLYEGVKPLGYQDYVDENEFMSGFFKYLEDKGVPNAGMLQDLIPNVAQGREERSKKLQEFYSHKRKGLEGLVAQPVSTSEEMPSLDDAWRLYLGLPQKNETFGISNYHPARSQEDKYYFKLNKFWDDFYRGGVSLSWDEYHISPETPDNVKYAFSSKSISRNSVESAVRIIKELGGEKASIVVETEYLAIEGGDVMYHFTMALGEDERGSYIAYYDKWDLTSSFSESVAIRGVGKPFEIYDRLYYNPQTFKPLHSEKGPFKISLASEPRPTPNLEVNPRQHGRSAPPEVTRRKH